MILVKFILLVMVFVAKVTESRKTQSFNLNLILGGLKNITSKSPCGQHINEYVQSLTSEESWAQKMLDSSAHTLHGIYMGNNKFLGHFDECLSVKHPKNLFEGQLCILVVDILDKENALAMVRSNADDYFDLRTEYFSTLFAICIPSTCEPKIVQEALQKWFNETEETGSIEIKLDEYNCSTEKSISSKRNNWLIMYVLITICILSLCSTAYDIIQRFYYQNDQPSKLCIAFSFYTNSSQIFLASSSNIKVLDGLKAIASFQVLYVHTFTCLWLGAAENAREYKKELTDSKKIINYCNLLETFFFISGFLVAYHFFQKIEKAGYYDFPVSFIRRYIRLTSVLAFAQCFLGWQFFNLGSGPLWNVLKDMCESSQKGWASTLLYSWNYVDPIRSYMAHTWTSNVDMQLFWLSPCVLIPILYYPSWAYFYVTALISVVTFNDFAVSYINGFHPTKITEERWVKEYIPTHNRAATWLMGVLFGYFLSTMEKKKITINLSTFQKLIGWTVSLLCILIGASGDYFLDIYSSDFLAALSIPSQRIFWAFGLAWVIFVCKEGLGGAINSFLSSRFFGILGKISYSFYIVHGFVIAYVLASMRTNYTAGSSAMINFIPTFWILTVAVAFLVTVLIEIPASNLSNCILDNVKILPLYKPVEKKLEEKEKKLK